MTSPHLLKQLLLSSRPVSWINTAFPFAAAWLMSGGGVGTTLIMGALFFLLPYNYLMYGLNDVFDYASDLNNPRKGGVEGALVPPSTHRYIVWSAPLLAIPFVLWLLAAGSLVAGVVLAASVFAVLAYSVPVLRFKERPLLDSLTSSFHFVSPALYGVALAGAHPGSTGWFALSAFFLWGCAAHAFGAVQDVVPDREGGIASVATHIGAARTVRLALALWLAAGLLMLATPFPSNVAGIIAVPYLINAWPYRNITDTQSGSANIAWRRFIWINYFAGFIVTLILISTLFR